jgi:predicted transporter
MELKSLILGIVFSLGIFAVKSGVGLSYYMSRTTSTRARIGSWAGFAVTYLLVFAAAGFILEKVDLMRHLEAIQKWIQSGMLVHLLMAGMMMLWGVRLLRNNGAFSTQSKGWLLLAIPCPVCATAILFSLGFLVAVYPDSLWMTAALLYGIFVLISLLAGRMMAAKKPRTSPESLLGAVMLIIAAYFFLSVAVMPNFADIDKIYRMACSSPKAPQPHIPHLLVFLAVVVATFLSGFSVAFYRIRRAA